MPQVISKISSTAVKRATGKDWDEWIAYLDKHKGRMMTHKEMARYLHNKGLIKNGWWCQMVTVGYEYARKKRVLGQTTDVGFEIGAQKTVTFNSKMAWLLITSPTGQAIWLGNQKPIAFKKGETFKTKNGSGEIRTVTKGERVRLRLNQTTLQVSIWPVGIGKSAIHFHHEKLKNSTERDKMRIKWQKALSSLAKAGVK